MVSFMEKVRTVIKHENIMQSITKIYLCLIITGLPLIVTDGYYNITETKAFYYASLSFCLIFISMINIFSGKSINLKCNFLDATFGCFGMFCVLSAVFSKYQSDVWLGTESRYQGAVMIVLYILVYFVVSRNYEQ